MGRRGEYNLKLGADGRVLREQLSKSESDLKRFEGGVKRLRATIEGGDKANAYAMGKLTRVVQDMGGVARLTETQLARVRVEVERLTKAGAKLPASLKGLGGPSGPGLGAKLKVAGLAELQGVGQGLAGGLGPAGSALASIGPAALAATAGVAALAAAGVGLVNVLADSTAEAVAWGAHIQEISDDSGIAADSVQRLIAAGLDMESVTGAVAKLEAALVNSPEKFAQLGLSAEALKRMKPEEALGLVAGKILQLGTEAERTAAKNELLGKSFPTSQMKEFADAAEKGARGEALGQVLDNATIAQLKAASEEAEVLGKTWDGLWRNMGAAIATSPGVQDALRGLTDALGEASTWVVQNKAEFQGLAQDVLVPFIGVLRDVAGATGTVVKALKLMATTAQAVVLPMSRVPELTLPGLTRRITGETSANAALAEANRASANWNVGVTAGREGIARMQAAMAAAMGKGGGGPTWDPKAEEKARKAAEAIEKLATANEKVKQSLQELDFAIQGDILAEQKRQDAEVVGQLNNQLQEQLRLMLQIDALGNSTVAGNASPEDIAAAEARQRVIAMIEAAGGRGGTGAGLSFGQKAGLDFLEQNKGNLSPEVYEKIRAQITGVKEETEKTAGATVSWAEAAQGVLAIIDALGLSGTKLGGLFGAIGGGAAAFDALGQRMARAGDAGGLAGLFKADNGKGGLSGILGGATSLLGGASAAIGIGKAIVGLFKSDPVKKAQKAIGQAMGVSISRELAESIRAQAKTLGVSLATAGLLSLGAVMAEGQAQGKSAASFSGQAISALQLTQDPKLAAQATGEVGQAFGEIAAEAERAGVFGTQAVRSIIREARNLKAEIPEIKAFVDEQLTGAAAGVGAGIKGIRVTSPEDIQAQASIASVTFWAVFKEKGLLAAGDAFKDIVASLGKSLEELGGDEIAQQLLGPIQAIVDLSENELFRGAAEGAQGFANTLKGLANSDIPLTTSQFGAFGQQAKAAFDQAIAGGASSEQALLAIAPLLQAIVQGAASYGLEIDEGTQALIEQAKASGIAFKTDGTERLIQSIDALTVALGGVPPALEKIGSAAEKLDGKTIDLTVRYNEPDMMPGQFNEGAFNEGGPGVTAAAGFGPKRLSRDTLFQAHAGEHVMIVPRGKPFSFRSARRGFFQDPEMGGDPGGGGLPAPGSLGGGGGSGTGTTSSGGGAAPPPDPAAGGVIEELQQQQAHTTTVLEDVKEILRTIARQPRGQVVMPITTTVQENGFNTQRDRQDFERGLERSVARGIRAGTSPVLDALKDAGFVSA